MLEIQDLGALEGPVLLFGGPYSNLEATRALWDWADAEGIPPGHRLCTGDIVAYCANPLETIALLQRDGSPVLAGNCEKQFATGGDDCGCGFAEGSTCDLLSKGWFAYADALLGKEERAYLDACPDRILFQQQERRYVLVHGGASSINRFLWPLSPEDDFWGEISLLQEEVGAIDGVISGHSGIPFRRNIDGIDWINAGAIGLPPHDGSRHTAFAVLEENVVRFEELRYDWRKSQKAMIAAGLTQGYEKALETGYWPSEEILPKSLRQLSSARG